MTTVHHLNCGTMCPAGARFIQTDGALLARGHMVCHCLLVETERDGLILVDTGFGTDDCAHPDRFERGFTWLTAPRFDRSETAFEQVRALGFQPDDVRHVIVTHLDLDHAGGLADFPGAQIHLHTREHEAAMARQTFQERSRYVPDQWRHGPSWVTYDDAGDDWFGLRSLRILEGIDAEVALVPLFGHTRGHSGVAVNSGDGWLLHAGDAYFHHDELATQPSCPLGLRMFQRLVAMDDGARRANTARLRELSSAHQAEVSIFSAHDPVELARFAQGKTA